ncbi:MAG: hypothetical protein R3C69_00720 [Geminicoccaceae bacterium]
MILGYRDSNTRALAAGQFVKAFQSFENQAAKRLSILNAAPSLETLRVLPSNRLEALSGSRWAVLDPDQPAMAHLLRVA